NARPAADALRNLYGTEVTSARAVLSGERDRNTAVKLAMGAGQRADRTFLPVFQAVACRSGCAFCCHGARIDVTAAEALTIARGFRETLSEAQLAVVRERVIRHANAIRSMTIAERYRARIPCALLDEASSRCAVHDARPMRCRAHHSLDAADCEAAISHPDEPRRITRYPEVLDAHEAMILGQKDALDGANVDSRHFELSLALDVALTQEDAAQRWARGERIFDAAVFTWPDE
ncbi:MAG TPA: YkgJ family cysteine cluster protein, partial [Polyangiaceae bacterium]|nr:YkgJ family cysteine cluster protein [Polyangiaceae bacterium]